jgi:hypothetical protein
MLIFRLVRMVVYEGCAPKSRSCNDRNVLKSSIRTAKVEARPHSAGKGILWIWSTFDRPCQQTASVPLVTGIHLYKIRRKTFERQLDARHGGVEVEVDEVATVSRLATGPTDEEIAG